MRGKIKTARKKADKLHGASAAYVSLVDMGANETPFTILKTANGAKAMTIKKRKTPRKAAEKKSHKPLTSAKKNDAVETRTETSVAKMVFSAELFEDQASVEAYLTEAEWDMDNLVITKNADGDFEAREVGVEDGDFDKIGEVETDEEGVYAFVGKREVEVKVGDDEPDEDDEDEVSSEEKGKGKKKPYAKDDDEDEAETEEKANEGASADEEEGAAVSKDDVEQIDGSDEKVVTLSKRQEFVQRRKEAKAKQKIGKFDAWDAMFSKGNTLAKTLADGMSWDTTPPGYYEVQMAFNAAVTNILGGEGMPEGTKQDALNKAAMDYAEVIGGLDTFFDAYVEMDEETVEKAISDEAEREAIAKWAEEYGDFVAGELDTPQSVAKAVEQKAAPAAIDYNEIGKATAEIVAKSLEPVMDQINGVTETVEAMASRAPTKKAADPEDSSSAGPRTVKTKADTDANKDWRRKTATKAVFG